LNVYVTDFFYFPRAYIMLPRGFYMVSAFKAPIDLRQLSLLDVSEIWRQ